MDYIDPYEGTKKGVLAKFSFKAVLQDRVWDNDRGSKDAETFYNDEYAVGFEGDLDYDYNVERFNEETLEGNAWVWIDTDEEIAALKAHSSFSGTKLLKVI